MAEENGLQKYKKTSAAAALKTSADPMANVASVAPGTVGPAGNGDRDPATRQLKNISAAASAEAGTFRADQADAAPDVDVPSEYDEPLSADTGIRESVLAGVQSQFLTNISNIQKRSQQQRRFRAGSTSDEELRAARIAKGEAIEKLGAVELEAREQDIRALVPIAVQEEAGKQARETAKADPRLALDQQKINIMAASVSIDAGRLQLDTNALAQSAEMFDVTTAEGARQFDNHLKEVSRLKNLSLDQEKSLAAAALLETQRQYDLSDTLQRDLFAANLAESARTFNLDQRTRVDLAMATLAQERQIFDITNQTQLDLLRADIEERARQFDLDQTQTATLASNALAQQNTHWLKAHTEAKRQYDTDWWQEERQFKQTRDNAHHEFNKQMDLARDKFDAGTDQFKEAQDQAQDQFIKTLDEGKRQYDKTTRDANRRFSQEQGQKWLSQLLHINETARQFNLDHHAKLKIAGDVLAQQSKEFDLTREDHKKQFFSNLGETARQFNLSQAQTRDLAIEGLLANERIANEQLNVQHLGNLMEFMVGGTGGYFDAEDGEAIIERLLDMSDIERSLNLGEDVTSAASNLITSLKNPSPDTDEMFAKTMVDEGDVWFIDEEEALDRYGFADPDANSRFRSSYLLLDLNDDAVVDGEDYVIYAASGGK